jgi:hypothetical protein
MSIDGRGSSLSRQADDRISALVSENERLKAAAKQALGERDRARGTAVTLEQQLGRIEARVSQMQREYTVVHLQNPSPSTAAAVDVLSAVEAVLSYVTDTVLADLIEEDEAAA